MLISWFGLLCFVLQIPGGSFDVLKIEADGQVAEGKQNLTVQTLVDDENILAIDEVEVKK